MSCAPSGVRKKQTDKFSPPWMYRGGAELGRLERAAPAQHLSKEVWPTSIADLAPFLQLIATHADVRKRRGARRFRLPMRHPATQ